MCHNCPTFKCGFCGVAVAQAIKACNGDLNCAAQYLIQSGLATCIACLD